MKTNNCILEPRGQNTLHRGATGKCWGCGCIPVSVSLSVGDRHRTTEWLEPTGTSGPSLSPAGSARPGYPGPYPGGFWVSPRTETTQPLQTTCAGVNFNFTVTTLFLFLFQFCAHCPQASHCVPLKISWLTLLTFPSGVYIHWKVPPELGPAHLCPILYRLWSTLFWCSALCQILQEMSAAAGLWTVTEKWHPLHV